LAENPKAHSRSKHITVKYHFVYYKVKKGRITLVYYQIDDISADGLTKILGLTKHLRFVNLLRIKDLPAELDQIA
jgi:methyl coenzyme M reductase subunit D